MTRIGLSLFGHAPEQHVPLAVAAEQLGFRDLWLGEHLAAPVSQRVGLYHEADIVRDDTELYDVWTTCGAMLGATQRICVAPGVLIAPLRHPVSTALSAVTAARLSGGRFRLGLGAGWLEEEFEVIGVDFRGRFARIAEIVEIVRLLSRGGAQRFEGEHYRFAPLRTTHEPVSFPVIFGGLTTPALQRAARLGDGWYGVPDLDAARLVEIREIVRRERGEGPDFVFHVRLASTFDPSEVDRLTTIGFDHLVVPWEALWTSAERRSLPVDGKIERLAAVARRIGLVA